MMLDALARHLLFKPSEEQLADAIDRSSFERLRDQEEKSGLPRTPGNGRAVYPRGPARDNGKTC